MPFAQVNAQSTDSKTVALESIGVLSAITMYNTYLAIGAVADGYGVSYEADYAASLMKEQEGFLIAAIDQLNALKATDFLDEDDKLFVQQTTECLNYLKMQAGAMGKYSQGESQADLDSYNFYRGRAWNMIEDLLGLGED